MRTVYADSIPKEMMFSQVDDEGWFEWKLVPGTLHTTDYKKIEKQFGVILPKSFVNWHKSYFFLDGDCSILRLPYSNPAQPLNEIVNNLEWWIPLQLIPHKIYPFASEGNDVGQLVFDGRKSVIDNEYPIRVYDQEFGGDLEGLSEIIFSSFSKLLECVTHYLIEIKSRPGYEIIPEFFQIDPTGAGKTGIDYWLEWSSMLKANFEEMD